MQKLFLTCLLVLTLLPSGRAVEAPATPSSAPAASISAVSLKVVDGAVSLVVDGVEISAEALAKGGTTPDGVSYSVSEKGISITSSTREILLDTPAELGITVNIPKTDSVILMVNAAAGTVDVKAGEKNDTPLMLKMSDGAFAKMNSGANAHVDLLKDGAYVLAGTGSMEGRNADGQKYTFTPAASVMVGGPTPVARQAAAVSVKITGESDSSLSVAVGEQTLTIGAGEKKTVTMANGAVIHLQQNAENGSLKWTVEKGDFVIAVDGIPTWKAIGIGGQQASMTWDSKIKTIDLKNEDSSRPVLVALPNRTFAQVESASTLQFSLMTSVMFATSAVGKVALYNNNTKEFTALGESNYLFDKGSLRNKTSGPGLPIKLNWDNGQPLKATGLLKNEVAEVDLKPGDPIKTMVATAEKEYELDYSQSGFLVIRSIEGKYNLKIQALNGLSLDLETGDNVTLKLDQKKGTFIVKADEWNNSDVSIHTANGFEPNLPPDRALNFNIKEDGSMEASNDGGFLVYTESATKETFTTVTPPKSASTDITLIRVTQPPVSVVR